MTNASSSIPILDGPSAPDAEEHLSGQFEIPREFVATLLSEASGSEPVHGALTGGGFVPAGPDAVESAWTVVAEAPRDVREMLAGVRARMRPGATLIAIVAPSDASAALMAGAAACVHTPLVPAELVAALRLASDARCSRERIAKLTRELDDQSVLVSLGRVSAGVTHEIAGPLAVIALSLESIEDEIRALRRLRDDLDLLMTGTDGTDLTQRAEALRAASRALDERECVSAMADAQASLQRIRALLAVMREVVDNRPASLAYVEVEEVVDRVLSSCARVHLDGVELERVVDEPLVAWAHPHLAEQILVNLVANAATAARELGTPRLRVHVYRRGDWAVISVRDNGPGIPRELHASIFEPFFTTRRARGGTGLGLALCLEYARQMGGRITLWSEPGRGACFRLHLRNAVVGEDHQKADATT